MNSPISLGALLAGAAFVSPALAQTPPAGSTSPIDASPSQPPPAQPALAGPSQPASAQPAASPPADAEAGDTTDDEGDALPAIVVTGSRPRGSVVGDIPPENTLDARDVRATGATSIDELLDALAPQIGSARGRGGEQPIFLLNGQRISSFRELRDIPTEAIERVDILPEEVALKYGYSANQKVVNFVLRQRFRSTTAQVGVTTATQGGYAAGTGDLTRLMIQKNSRTTLNLHAAGNGMLRESDRNILLTEDPIAGATAEQELAARSLLGSKRDLRAGATFNRQVLGDVSATLNTEVEHTDGRSLIGLSDTLLEALGRKTTSDTAHAGVALNWDKWDWRWSVTGNADIGHDTTRTNVDQGNLRAHEDTISSDFMATANGNLFKLPGGMATTTVRVGGSTSHLNSESDLATARTSLGRTAGTAAINADLPISHRGRDFSALGNLTLNANAEVQQLSDFGTLTTLGAGFNMSPVDRLSFIGSWTREEGAPTIQQLGDPVLQTPNTRIFDFTTGQTVLVTSITGGNPGLQSDRRSVFKFGTNWQPWQSTDLKFRADFVHQTIARPISDITVTQQIESAFPDRFTYGTVCDPEGTNCRRQLTQVDLRPVNFDRSQRDTLRVGFDFSHPLKSHRPSQAVMDQMRAQMRAQFGFGRTGPQGAPSAGAARGPGSPRNADGSPTAAGAPPAGGPPPPDAGGPAPGGSPAGGFGGFGGGGFGNGRGGGGGFFGGRGGTNRGRLQFSLTDTITFVDKVSIAPGVQEIDYLHGGAAGESGGTPRHSVEAQAGYFNNGLGARLGANWRSGTTVTSLTGDNLHFSPLATFNLTLFANPGDIPEVVVKHPWLRSTQVRFQVTNLFNSRPNVRDASGAVPLSYQPQLIDPLGRTVMISIRKLFLPSPAYFRRQFQDRQQQGAGTR
ncbi:TonB-dependent receptor [Sphingomonas sp.]|uniref:TonB-dependent receptor n=1 Tax=Sphingomonas sp. TaxID=28214 RepID=UPI0025D2B9FE|nr:TonB-dependent receptor [Sphingomonas sp.]MBV9527854.1 TonB-dependent receptor [Sphingomonas sp.]